MNARFMVGTSLAANHATKTKMRDCKHIRCERAGGRQLAPQAYMMCEMTTWADVEGALRRAFSVAGSGPDWLGLDVPVSSGTKRVRVELVSAFEREWVLFLSRVAVEGDL